MRRIAMILAVVMAFSAFIATAAYAGNQIIRCAGIPCYATGKSDLVYERKGNGLNDRIKGGAGGDKCYVDARVEAVNGCGKVIVQ